MTSPTIPSKVTDRPLAAEGLQSYRYKGIFGWIMIGAKDDEDALKEARRSMSTSSVQLENLEKWDGTAYVSAIKPPPGMMSKLEVEEVIATSLVSHGWSRVVGAAMASKTFQTAVGDKVAHIYFEGNDRDLPTEPSRSLKGDYQSEGRNALEPWSILIPKAAAPDEVQRLVAQFAIKADKAVSNTYAAKLNRPRW